MPFKKTTLFFLAAALYSSSVFAADFIEDVKHDTRLLCQSPSRLLGSPGHNAAREMLATRIQSYSAVEKFLRQTFPVMIPETQRSDMTIPGGEFAGTHSVYPVWPDNVRMNTTPADGIKGRIVYIGTGQYSELPAKSLRGSIAAIEMSVYSEKTWLRAFEFGARAVLLLGSDDDSVHVPTYTPIYKPRYYIPDGPLAQAIREEKINGKATIHCDGKWVEKTGENLLAVVPGSDPSLKPILLIARYDAMSMVPGLAPGADNAVDAAFLLRTLDHLSQFPPRRGVIVAFVDAFGFNLMGTRELMGMLSITPDDLTRQAYEKSILERTSEYEKLKAQVDGLGPDYKTALPKLSDATKYKELQRYVKDIMSPEIIALREEIFALRLQEVYEKGDAKAAITALKKKKEARQQELNAILSGIISKGKLPTGDNEETAAMFDRACATIFETLRHRVQTQLDEIRQQPLLFKSYDDMRGKVLAGLGLSDYDTVPVPFVLGIDLSDSGINVGPAFEDAAHFMNYNRSGREFTSWLKSVLKNTDNPYARISDENLADLGLQANGIQQLVKRILNEEAVEGSTVQKMVRETIPEIGDEVVDRVITEISRERAAGAAQMEKVAFRIIASAMPDLEQEEIETLVDKIINQESIQSGVDANSLSIQRMALLTNVAGSFQMTGVTWSTLESIRHRLDTPQDTCERLNWQRLVPQIRITALLVDMLLNDPEFKPVADSVRSGTFPKWRMPDGVLVSESVAETIARTPQPGMLVTTFNGNPKVPQVVAMRGHEFVRTGSDGRFRFRPKPADTNWPARNRRLKGYKLDEHGRIIRSIVKITSMFTSEQVAQYSMNQKAPLAPLRADTFECVEVNGPKFRDPRYQSPMSISKLFDVGRGGLPKKYVWGPVSDPMFALLEPGTRYQVILGKGGGKNRMALMNVPKDLIESEMKLSTALKIGFPADKPLPALPELISARDFFLIDEWRLRRLEGAGVVCEAIREIHEGTRRWLQAADEAYEADDGAAYKRAATVALANEVRVYQAAQDQANDVTRGAIFLLLLLVPFSVAMERLLFASPEIGKQISKAMIIFVVMFVALASFHPGFKITSMPAVILIAFMVLLLSVSVINMILRKFRADMEELRRGTLAEASGAQTGRGGVIMSAIWLGIANMRKRFVRTMLTGLTIVLVTFSLLCFTSSSTYQNKRTTTLEEIQTTQKSVLLQHPSEMPLDGETLESVANMLGGDKEVIGRYWAVSTTAPEWRIHVRNAETNQLATLKAGLGLDPGEDQFIGTIPIVLNNWQDFAAGDGCYVSRTTAERLGAQVGDEVVIAGTTVKIIDTFDPREIEKKLTKLDGQSILPLDYSVETDDWTMGDQSTMESSMASGEMAEPDPTLIHVSGDEVVILPISLAKHLDATLRSIGIKSASGESTPKTIADGLVKDIAYPLYYGAKDGVKVIVSTPLIPKAPRKIFIPILIAALIIFNTMLNSIAERKKEIYIYSSLGLAPRHIGVLFLAEALTYGVMGSVFGYIIGQGVATILTKLDLMGGITLNYSGSNVILTMGLVLLVVVLSALVPAYMAAKVASPSGDLDWKVPTPKDRCIRGLLPFTVSLQAAPGLAAFLYDYLIAHGDGAIGNFTSDNVRLDKDEGDSVICLKSTIWPAPYDLGVRQDVAIRFKASEGNICDLHFQLDHQAGPERSWWRLNRVFLGSIRAQLLGWRNVAPERMLRYIRQADGINK